MTWPGRTLLLLAAVLAAVLGIEATGSDPALPPVPSPVLALPSLPQRAPKGVAAAQVGTVLARPLFSSSRRPDAPTPAVPADAQPEPRLVGTLVGPFGRRALLVSSDGHSLPAAGEAGRVGAWTLERIVPGSVTLVGPGGTRELHLAAGAGVATRTGPDVTMPAWSWANPCGRPHQRGMPGDVGQAERCGVKAADLGRAVPQP